MGAGPSSDTAVEVEERGKQMRYYTGSRARRQSMPVRACLECGTEIMTRKAKRSVVKADGHCYKCGGKIVKFDSRKELKRWKELKLLEKAGKIINLRRQVRIGLIGYEGRPIVSDSGRQLVYVADATYYDLETGDVVIEDTKPGRVITPESALKIAILRAMWSGPGRRVVIHS